MIFKAIFSLALAKPSSTWLDSHSQTLIIFSRFPLPSVMLDDNSLGPASNEEAVVAARPKTKQKAQDYLQFAHLQIVPTLLL